jgi:hypothetical protein
LDSFVLRSAVHADLKPCSRWRHGQIRALVINETPLRSKHASNHSTANCPRTNSDPSTHLPVLVRIQTCICIYSYCCFPLLPMSASGSTLLRRTLLTTSARAAIRPTTRTFTTSVATRVSRPTQRTNTFPQAKHLQKRFYAMSAPEATTGGVHNLAK